MGTIEKQGIVSILRSDSDQTKAPSLRRTLSADMSSKKWMARSGLVVPHMKKIASSERLPNLVADSSSSSDEEEDESEGKNKEAPQRPGSFDIWSSILLSKKADDDESSKLPPPYVHPLVKRSTSALSGKSLEICTESLGSETGSEVFSSPASSDAGDAAEEEDKEVQPQPQTESQSLDREDLPVAKNNNYPKKVVSSSGGQFPPPLPSLARCDGLHMHSHRENGRLVLEAVSIPSQNYFHAQREAGRLVLTFAETTPPDHHPKQPIHQEELMVIDHKEEEEEEDVEEIFEADEKDVEDEEEEEEIMGKVENNHEYGGSGAKEIELVMEQATKLPRGVINVHRSALMIKKLIGLDNRRNPSWTTKYNNKPVHLVDMEEEEEEEEGPLNPNPLAQSLPRPSRLARLIPPAAAAAPHTTPTSFNTYEYFWRAKPTAVNPINKNSCDDDEVILSNNTTVNTPPKAYEEQGMVLLRGNKADYLVPLLKGYCKEPRRSLLLWEPYCIATS